ncbi:MAG: hypothetical protein G3M70_05100 [Candidatus Nitronauta litoralis]|uniref:Uncharacterized protein n=1 Tax=Candidatus Nitronauta litoralis TaxID=2705533 RepID=A0A7T0BUJ8_9BACT|nr:MAG: hypothetical protein G3M70_05100 [Candidatus Nitronauta litoralis]
MITDKSPSTNPKRLRKKALGLLCTLVLAGSLAIPSAWGAEGDDERLQALEQSNRQLKKQVSLLQKQIQTLARQNRAGFNSSEGTNGQTNPPDIGIVPTALEAKVQALQILLSGVERNGNSLIFNGMNLEVNNGLGATDGPVNGLGNIIIGYNENIFPYLGDGPSSQKTGSHNLVVGKGNNYMSYGGIVSGLNNWISGTYATVTGGERNQALGGFSSVFAGSLNQAAGLGASAGSGQANAASGAFSTSFGGLQNVATGDYGSSLGGLQNQSIGNYSSTTSGSLNTAIGVASGITGGLSNQASGDYANVNGGLENNAGGIIGSVGGGLFNSASGAISHVCGGLARTAGGTTSVQCR